MADEHISLGVFVNSHMGAVAFAIPILAGSKEIESWFTPTLAEKKDD